MNVFCNRESCKFQLNQMCRTSAISVEKGECTTYAPVGEGQSKAESAVFWGHLEASPPSEEHSG